MDQVFWWASFVDRLLREDVLSDLEKAKICIFRKEVDDTLLVFFIYPSILVCTKSL